MPKEQPVENLHYDGVGFNKAWVKGFGSADEFIDAAEPHLYQGERNRKEMLTDVWNLAQETPKAIEKMMGTSGGDLSIAVEEQKAAEEPAKGKKKG